MMSAADRRVPIERALCPVLVGRGDELRILDEALGAARRGEEQIILLSGDAGVGKTRLATELERRALSSGMLTLWGGCSEADPSLPYLPFLEAIGNALRTVDVEELRRRLGPLSPAGEYTGGRCRPAGNGARVMRVEPTRTEPAQKYRALGSVTVSHGISLPQCN